MSAPTRRAATPIPVRMRLLPVAALFVIVGLVSCSGGSGPLAPSAPDQDQAPAATPDLERPWQAGASSPFGLLSGTISPDGTVKLDAAVRDSAAVGTTYDIDATQFFTQAPCRDCVQLTGFANEEPGLLRLDFALRHPFPGTLPRRDLHVFDVRGILILPGATEFGHLTAPVNKNLTAMETETLVGDPLLVRNADGFTTHFDYHAEDPRYRPHGPAIPGNLNAYKRYFEDPATPVFNPADPAGWNVMAMGAGPETQSYLLDKSRLIGTLPFAFVVDVRWGESATKPTRQNPTYYLPAFSRQEAWRVDVAVPQNNLQAGDVTTRADLAVSVYDWQAAAGLAEHYPDPAQPHLLPWPGDVALIEATLPGVHDLATVAQPVSGGGTPASPYVYELALPNTHGAPEGYFTGLVAVRDALYANNMTGPGGLPELPGVMQGLDVKDYSTYQVFTVAVVPDEDDPPVANASATAPVSVLEGELVTLDGSLSMDDSAITKFEWNPGDGTGWVDRGLTPTLVHSYAIPGSATQHIFTATLRVTDDSAQQSTDTVQITVSSVPDNPPMADAQATPSTVNSGGQVTLTGSGSTDDFGITKYRWNPGDGTGWVDRGTNPEYVHTYTSSVSTQVTATLEVTDTSNQTATDTVLISITVQNQPPVASLSGTNPSSGVSPLTVNFVGSSSSDDQGITKFEWDPGDGTGWVNTGAVPIYMHVYTSGTTQAFNARLRVTDGGGLTDIASTTINVTGPDPCSLTGISGPTALNKGQIVTLSAVGTSSSYAWSESSPRIQFVGATNGPTVQVEALAASVSLNDIQVTLTGSGPGCVVTRQLTVHEIKFIAPAAARRQYVNWANGGPGDQGTNVLVTAQVVPAKSGVNLTFSFSDPDEPAYTHVAGTNWTGGGQTIVQLETDTDPNDNQGDSIRPNGTATGQPYTVGYDHGGGTYQATITAATGATGEASAWFRVSRYGGDNYHFHAAGDPGSSGMPITAASPMVTVWRKYLVPVYSMQNSGGTDPWFYKPDYSKVNDYFGPSYIEIANLDLGYGGMAYLSPLNLSVSDQFAYVETTGNYASAGEKYAQTPHGQFCGGINRYSSSGTIGLWTGSYNPAKLPPTGTGLNDKPYNTRNYVTVATGRIKELWTGTNYTNLVNHVFVHEIGHGLGLPHNSSSTTGNPALTKHGSNGIGIMAPATGPGVAHYFTLSELRFLRGADTVDGTIYRGPYYE